MLPFVLALTHSTRPLPPARVDPPDRPVHTARQHTLTASGPVHRFRNRFGPWTLRWNEDDSTPAMLTGPGIPVERGPELAAAVARLAGIDPADLVAEEPRERGDRMGWRWSLRPRGTAVVGRQGPASIDLFSLHGRIHLVRADLIRVPSRDLDDGWMWAAGPDARPVPVRVEERGERSLLVSATGAVVQTWTHTLDATLVSDVWERDPSGARIDVPAEGVTVLGGMGSEVTDATGVHTQMGPVDATLSGPWVEARDVAGVPLQALGVDDDRLDDVDLDPGARTTFHHVHEGRDWLASVDATHPWLAFQVPVVPSYYPNGCIGQFASGTLRFSTGIPGACDPSNQHADIVKHEYGHGVHAAGLLGGVFAVDVSEGSADFMAATQSGDPVVAPGFYAGTPLRELEPDRVFPDDYTGAVHQDGRIWGSLLWNLRQDWAVQYPDGVARTDRLLVDTLSYGPAYPDMTEAVLAANDDDGDLSNGTPDDCDLLGRLEDHGLGNGGLGLVVFDHVPLGPQPSMAPTGLLPVSFELSSPTPACSSFDPDSARLHWVAEPDPSIPLDGQASVAVPVRNGAVQTVDLPAQPAGTTVVYWVTWDDADGEPVRVPDVPPELATSLGATWATGGWAFQVGDAEPLVCQGFESGLGGWTTTAALPDGTTNPGWTDEWSVGAPTAAYPSPSEAFEGTQILATALDAPYGHDNGQTATAPVIDASGPGSATLLRLEARRHASFEGSTWDRARVTVPPDTLLWENPDRDLFDPDWVPFTVDLRAIASPFELAFSLESDGGVAYGGWNLDDVCVTRLADPEGHFTVQDTMVAASGSDAVVSWTHPFVRPLAEVRVVRSDVPGHVPIDAADGVLVATLADPAPGATASITDPGVTGPAIWAVFAVDPSGGPVVPGVLGVNAAELAPPADTADTGSPTDTGVFGPTADTGIPAPTADTGGDADTDTDTDADADADADTDADSDADADADTDTDADSDADADTDTDADSDADADTDADADADTDTEPEPAAPEPEPGCGCASGAPTVVHPGLPTAGILVLTGLLARRRRTPC